MNKPWHFATLLVGTLADLETDLWVTVVGQRGEDGAFDARSVLITLGGVSSFLGGGQQRVQQAP